MNGIINVYKEAGFTSFDVVAKLRGVLKIKKIGHTGTLDPDAVGVLPICVGNATKLVDMLTDETKEYIAIMKLGVVTDTQDMSGNVLEEHYDMVPDISDELIKDAIMSMQGDIMQIPPMYSALKVDGRKLYELARAGIEVERKARPVRIDEIEILDMDSKVNSAEDLNNERYIKLRVVCSKGTYIRTLIHDIGQELGCGASMQHLTRTRVGSFGIESSVSLDEIQKAADSARDLETGRVDEAALKNIIKTVDSVFEKYDILHVEESGNKALINGNQLQTDTVREVVNSEIILKSREIYRIYNNKNVFYGIYEYHSGWKVLKPVKMFLPS